MNPAFLVVVLLSLAGLALGRDCGRAWCVLGLSAALLLAPSLRLPDGVPSPAADLASHAPWASPGEGGGLAGGGNPALSDVTYQIQPWLFFLHREVRQGRLPLWNPHQFAGSPFWANGQAAPLFPLHVLFVCLPLQIGLVLLPWLRLLAAGCGTWALARRLGASADGALVAALSFSLSGMLVSFALYPMGNALCLVPWVLWAVEGLGARRGWRALALVAGLQALAGHPETVLHTALLAALYLFVRGGGDSLRRRVHFAVGWTVAAAMGAIHNLPLAFVLGESSRWHAGSSGEPPPLGLLLKLPLRLLVPNLFGNPAHGDWWGPFYYPSTAVYAGAVALPLAVVGLGRIHRDRRRMAVAVVLAFSFAGAYHLPGAHQVLQAAPLLGRALHHRLLFGVALGLALLAGLGFDRWRHGEGRRALWAGAAGVILLLAVAWWVFAADWRIREMQGDVLAWSVFVAGVAVLLVVFGAIPRTRGLAARLVPVLVVWDLVAAHAAVNPGLSFERLYPRTPAVEWLQGQEGRVAAVGETLRPNAALVYGFWDIRGDDPLKSRRYDSVYGSFATPHPFYFRPVKDWRSPWLDRLGVRWVMTPPATPPPGDGPLVFSGSDAWIYERRRSYPLVRWRGSAGDGGPIEVVSREPGRWELAWSRARDGAVLVVAESWDPGWRARLDGRRIPVERVDEILMGVQVGGGPGRLVLAYRPPGILWGAALTLVGLLALVVPVAPDVLTRRRRRRGTRQRRAEP